MPFHLILVESGSSIIKAMRMVTVSPVFRTALTLIMQKQVGERFDLIEYYKKIGDIYKVYPSAASMAEEGNHYRALGMTIAAGK